MCAHWCARAFAARGVTFKFSAIAGLIVVHDALHFVDACGSGGDVRASLCAVWCACACVGVFFFFALLSSTPHSPRYWVNPGRDGVQASEHDSGDCARSHTHTFVLNTKHVCACVCAAASVFGASSIERIFGRCAPETFNWKCKRTGEIASGREREIARPRVKDCVGFIMVFYTQMHTSGNTLTHTHTQTPTPSERDYYHSISAY